MKKHIEELGGQNYNVEKHGVKFKIHNYGELDGGQMRKYRKAVEVDRNLGTPLKVILANNHPPQNQLYIAEDGGFHQNPMDAARGEKTEYSVNEMPLSKIIKEKQLSG